MNCACILIVSHDAGGAEILSAWVAEHKEHRYLFCLEGPAEAVFRKKFSDLQVISWLEVLALKNEYHFMLTGTSWTSNLERNAIHYATSKGIKVAAYLDHWVNYKERFKGVTPDQIWVGDAYAMQLARQCFPNIDLEYVENAYFKAIKQRASEMKQTLIKKRRLLFLSQPISESGIYSFTEYQAFSQLLKSIKKSKKIAITDVLIRLHPSESKTKYASYMDAEDNLTLSISQEEDLLVDCLESQLVVGCFSMALVVADMIGCPSFSSVPDEFKNMTLPYPGIHSFSEYLSSI